MADVVTIMHLPRIVARADDGSMQQRTVAVVEEDPIFVRDGHVWTSDRGSLPGDGPGHFPRRRT